tara:strand:- start:853 stop:1776 length:924 start_codon:yes stop_codon:yes gene_type:complete
MAESMQQVEEAVDQTVEVEVEEATTEEATLLEQVEVQPTETQQEPEKDVSDEQEIAEYSESVKKRINKLTYKIREAERREQAAIEYAKGVQEKLNTSQANLSQKDQNLYDEYSARVDTQLQSAEDRYKQAHDIGDTDAMLSAQKDVAKLAVEQESLTRVKPEPKVQETPVEVPQIQQQQQPVAQQSDPDPKAQDWATKNSWFGEDLAMTTSAFAFHRQLVEKEGYDPASDEYYSEVDNRMAKAFPHKFNNGGEVSQLNNNMQEPVANSSRGTRGKAGKARTVKLSPSQVAIAKRLGVPLEEYAKHVK